MNRNNQIDWNDTDRIVSNDTRYVSLNGDWWRESSTWQTRQNGSPALTRVGLTRTRLTGLANNGDERLANNGEAASSPLVQNGSILISETHSLDPLNNETVACTFLDRSSHTTTQTTLSPNSTLPAETVARCGLTVSTRTPTDVTTIYAYDAFGRRVTTRNAEGSERHVYDDNWQVVADLDEEGNVLRSYVWGEGIDRLLAVKIGSKTYTALTDVQGTVWGYADASGNIVARWTYDAWGNVLSEEADVSAAELRAVRYRFQGRERSAATGLTNFRMRWYDAETGRWLSKDPIGLSGGLNLYAFCGGDPINQLDCMGESTFGDIVENPGAFFGGFVDAISEGELMKGLAATADGFLPFCDPFESVYSDECGNYDSAYDVSHLCGAASFGAFMGAILAPEGLVFGGSSQVVTHWSVTGEQALNAGDWVMTGSATIRNWIMAGGLSPAVHWVRGSPFVTAVPKSALSFPKGWEWIKGLIGQRIYTP